MNVQITNTNYRNDAIFLDFSELKRLKTRRSLVLEHGLHRCRVDQLGRRLRAALNSVLSNRPKAL